MNVILIRSGGMQYNSVCNLLLAQRTSNQVFGNRIGATDRVGYEAVPPLIILK
jgi:hypothetical protein